MQSSLSSLYQIFGDLTNIGSIVMGVLGLLFCSLLLAGLCKGDDAWVDSEGTMVLRRFSVKEFINFFFILFMVRLGECMITKGSMGVESVRN